MLITFCTQVKMSTLVLEQLNPDDNEKIYAIYKYGSQVYGTIHDQSDHDFIVVSDKELIVSIPAIDITTYTLQEFQQHLDNNEIWALECVFSTPVYLKYVFNVKIDIQKLRSSVSRTSSQAFNKAKKKFISPYDKEEELLRGKKSLFHSLRVLMFGVQIAKYHKITNYHEANDYFFEIMSNSSDKWEDYMYFKPKYNALMTSFRKLAPK